MNFLLLALALVTPSKASDSYTSTCRASSSIVRNVTNDGWGCSSPQPIMLYTSFASSATLANSNLQTLGSYTLSSGTLANAGDSLFITCVGTMVVTSLTKTVEPTFNGTALGASISATTATSFISHARIGKIGSNTQNASWDQGTDGPADKWKVVQGLTATDTGNITITCSGQSSGGGAADITMIQMMVELFPSP